MRGVAQGSALVDPETGGVLFVGHPKQRDPFELIELCKRYGAPGALHALAMHEIQFSLDLGTLVSGRCA